MSVEKYDNSSMVARNYNYIGDPRIGAFLYRYFFHLNYKKI